MAPEFPRRLRVLVVDDCADTRETIALLVDLCGHDARTARDGPAALAVAAGYRPDVVLLDVAMPGMDGWEVARRLRRDPATGQAYIVGVTGFARDADRRSSSEAGCDEHWAKPFEVDRLGKLLASLKQRKNDECG
jgi:two-component system OmpR family response regulator